MTDEFQVLNVVVDQTEVLEIGEIESLCEEKNSSKNGTCWIDPFSLNPETQETGTQVNRLVPYRATDTKEEPDTRPIVLTGFGPVSEDDSTNTSQLVVQDFYNNLEDGKFSHGSQQITILTGTDCMMEDRIPIKTSYDFVTSPEFDDWLQNIDARLFVHLGTNQNASGNPIWFEERACNGPISSIIDRTWWTKDSYGSPRYIGECVRGGRLHLNTSFVIPKIIDNVKKQQQTDYTYDLDSLYFIDSNDAGRFLCNFLYYRSLYYAQTKDTHVIFIHVPETLRNGVLVGDITLVLVQIVHCLLDLISEMETEQDMLAPPAPKMIGNGEIVNRSQNEDTGSTQDTQTCIRNHAPMKHKSFSGTPDATTTVKNDQIIANGCQKSALYADKKSQASGHHQVQESTSHKPCHNADRQSANRDMIWSQPSRSLPVVKSQADTMQTIVVTGFGPIYSSPNLSWQAVKKFYYSQRNIGKFEYNGVTYRLLAGPPDPKNNNNPMAIETTYDFVNEPDFVDWLSTKCNARLYVHFGVDSRLNSENGIRFDKQACNGYDGYWIYTHNRTYHGPCVDEDREYRCTQFTNKQIDDLVTSCLPDRVKKERINGSFKFQSSNDTGRFLCDFLYYRSLYYCSSQTREVEIDSNPDERPHVIFVHIPSSVSVMDSKSLRSNIAGIKPMSLVIEEIVKSLLDMISEKNRTQQ